MTGQEKGDLLIQVTT